MDNVGFTSVPLSEVAEFTNGYSFGPADWGTSGLPIVRIQQLLDPGAPADFFRGSLDRRYRIDTGDLVMSWSGTIAVVQWDGGPAWLNQHLFRVDAKAGVEAGFLKHLLDSRLGHLEAGSHGTTMKHIKRGDLLRHEVPLPPREQQRRIAEILDTIDEAIRATERAIAKHQRIRQGLESDLLTATRHGSHHYVTLGELAELNPEALATHTPPDYAFYYIDLSSVSRGLIDTDSLEFLRFSDAPSRARRVVRDGDVLFGTVRPHLRSHARVRGDGYVASTGFCVTRAKPGLSDGGFLGHFLLSDEASRQATRYEVGSNYPAVAESDVAAIKVPGFPLEEQLRIAEVLDAAADTIRVSEQERDKLRSLRVGVSADLLSGTVRTVAA